MEQKSPPPSRQEIIATCPDLQSSPTQVRDWFKKYLEYRGLEPASSKKFFLRGLELHRASYTALTDAFKQYCGILDWEAEVLAYDVYTIIEASIPLPKTATPQVYVEKLFRHEFCSNSIRRNNSKTDFLGQANRVFDWLRFMTTHPVLLLLTMVIFGLLTCMC
ncbi:hypothetical protein F5Y09DRAFT_144836 [Xylaria sp. FL1042]|nr:hypothetical protein F5Y09DRAFT_144836 [Xylaria sp. FL1042]